MAAWSSRASRAPTTSRPPAARSGGDSAAAPRHSRTSRWMPSPPKLDPSGSRLVYSTYLGGTGDDVGNAVALDDAGSAYYAGFSQSPEFPTTPGGPQAVLRHACAHTQQVRDQA